MAYELDLSSETTKAASDLANNQAMIVVDADTNRAKLIVKDSAGDSFDMNFMPPAETFVADPVGAVTDQDDEARAMIVAIRDKMIALGLMEAGA